MSATPRCIVVDAQGVPVSDAGRPSVLEFPDWEIATAWLERSKLEGHRVVRLERIHPSVVRDCRKVIASR